MTAYPCLVGSSYTACVGAQACTATSCWAGRKPPQALQPGQRACGRCGRPYTRPHGSRADYCTAACKYDAMIKRRHARQGDSTQRRIREPRWNRQPGRTHKEKAS